jgi:hypothetical protein
MLMAASALQAVGFAGMGPARMAFTSELVGAALVPNAVVLGQLSMNANRVLGPSLAGVMIGVPAIGVGGVYVFGTIVNLAALAMFLRLPPGRPAPGRPQRAPLAEMADGARYAFGNRPVFALLVVSTAVIMTGFPYISFLPSVAEDFFGAGSRGYSLLSVTGAVGGLCATLFIAGRASGSQAGRLLFVSGLAFALGLAALGLAPSLTLAAAATFFLGGANSAFQSINSSLMLAQSDPAYHGRVQSLVMLGFSGFGLAALPLGALADAIGLDVLLVAMGVAVAVSVTAYHLLRPGRAEPAD